MGIIQENLVFLTTAFTLYLDGISCICALSMNNCQTWHIQRYGQDQWHAEVVTLAHQNKFSWKKLQEDVNGTKPVLHALLGSCSVGAKKYI